VTKEYTEKNRVYFKNQLCLFLSSDAKWCSIIQGSCWIRNCVDNSSRL